MKSSVARVMRKAPGLEQALSSGSRAMSFLIRERGSWVVPVASDVEEAAAGAAEGAAAFGGMVM